MGKQNHCWHNPLANPYNRTYIPLCFDLKARHKYGVIVKPEEVKYIGPVIRICQRIVPTMILFAHVKLEVELAFISYILLSSVERYMYYFVGEENFFLYLSRLFWLVW